MSRGAFISSSNFLSIPLVTCHRSTFWGAFIFKIATLLAWKMCVGKIFLIEDFQNIKNWSSPNLKDHLFICLPLRKTAIRRTLNQPPLKSNLKMPSLGQGHLGWIKVLDTFFFGGLDKFAITYKVIFKLPAESVQKFLMKTSPQAKRHKSSLHVTSLHFFSLLCLF